MLEGSKVIFVTDLVIVDCVDAFAIFIVPETSTFTCPRFVIILS